MNRFALLLSACSFCLLGLSPVQAQQPGGLDPAFTPVTVDVGVSGVLPRPGGRALVAGRFSTWNGTAVGPVVQLTSDGKLDPAFANNNRAYLPAGDDQVNSIVIATDAFDRTYVALTSTPSFTGTLVRLYANGTLDPAFHATIDGAPSAMVAQPNGQVIIAGSFSTLNGVTVQGNLARLREDGSTDPTFDVSPRPGVPTPDFTFVYQLALQTDGKVIAAGGLFPTYNAGLARFNADGSRDTAFALGNIPGLTFQALALQPDGNLIVTYNTSTYNGQPYAYAARIKARSTDGTDGQIDPTFQPGNALPTFPRQTVLQQDGKLVFSLGASIVRLNADGSADRAFTFGAPSNGSDAAAYAQTGDGNLIVAGSLVVGNQYVQGVARLLGSVPGGAATVNVVVPGNANVWLARDESTDAADVVPVQAPVRVVDLALVAGSTLSFAADGAVDFGGSAPTDGPDGQATYDVDHAAENGVSGINAPLDALVGVFIDDATAASAVTPAALDFGTADSRDFSKLNPELGQVFYIGDGKNSGGTAQQFTVPAGAMHLVLGTVDGLGWYNNTGAFVVTITPGVGGGGGGGGGAGGALTVPGTADVWLAGAETGLFASRGADQAPAQSPVLVPGLTLDPNKGLIFTVGGKVTTGGSSTAQYAPDGGTGFVAHADENNVSGTTAPTGALVGVFASDNAPAAASLPSARDFSFIGTGNNSYSPRLQQVFFIGDGKDGNNNPQTFYPPTGATRLFLGVMDGTVFKDNGGSFGVGVATSTVDPTDLRVGESVTSSSTPGGNGSFALIGDKLTYSFTVRNFSKATMTRVVLRNTVPSYTDISKLVATDGFYYNGVASWSIGDLAPGATATRTLQLTLTNAAPLGLRYTNKGYSATADGYPDVAGRDFPDTLIESAVSVKITNDAATAGRPGGTVRFIYDLLNTTPTTFKKLTLTVPILNGVLYGDAYFVDSNGTRLDAQTVAKYKETAVYDPASNAVIFTLDSLKSTDVYLALELQIPYNFDPKGSISLPGARIEVKKANDGQPISLALADSTTPLSGLPALKAPSLVFGKSVVTGDIIAGLLAANPNSATLLNSVTLQPYLALNPDQKAVQKLGAFTSLAVLTPAQRTLVFNPFVGSDVDPDSNTAVSTVPAPSAKAPSPFVTFALAFVNTGSAKAAAVTLYDSAPKGLEIDRDSFFVNGVAVAQSKIQFNDDGSFALPIKSLKTDKGGLVFYRARVLAPADPPSGVQLGSYIEPTSAQMTVANLTEEFIAPAPDPLLFTGPAHASVSSTQTGDTSIGGNVTYTILYKNDGGQTISDFRVISPVPPGGAFQSAQFLGLDQQGRTPNTSKGESFDSPGANAVSGLAVFHLGKVKARGVGLVRVVYKLTANVVRQPSQALVHQPYVAATGGLPVTNALAEDSPLHRQLRRMVTRDANDANVGAGAAPNVTRLTNNPNGPHIAMTVTCPPQVNTGDTFAVVLTVVSLGNTDLAAGLGDPSIVFSVPTPAGAEYVGLANAVQAGANADGSAVTGFMPSLPSGGASYVTVTYRARAAAKNVIRIPDVYVLDALTQTTLHSGPVVTTVTSPDSAFYNLNLAVAQAELNSVSTATYNGQNFTQRVSKVSSLSRFTVVVGADFLSLENGVVIIPTIGGNIVAQGGGNLVNTNGSNIVAQGGGNIVAQGGGNIVAQGGGNLISIKNLVDGGGKLISQDGNNVAQIFAGIVAQGGGNIVAQGGGNIVAQGGGNLQSVGVKVISNDGGTFAASADKALAISQADLASFGQSAALSGEVFRSETGNATFAGSGYVAAAAGGGIQIRGLVHGSSDNLTVNHLTAQGNFVRGGSGIVAQGGGN